MMWDLNPEVVIRAESRGALLFNPGNAETAYIDREALSFLRQIIKGEITVRKIPVSLILYLQRKRLIVRSEHLARESLEEIEGCLKAEKKEIPNSLCSPETLHLALTNVCDQSCPGCFYSKGNKSPEIFLFSELFKKILKEAQKAKVFQFAFGGGEPLLHPQILPFVKETKRANIVPNITTNGNLLTLELASELKKAGLGQLQISLDGSSPEVNAQTRPNHNKAIKAMRICKTTGLRFGINTLVTRSNFRALPSLFSFAQRIGAEGVNLLRPKPPVNASEWLSQSSLRPSENRELHKLLRQKTNNGRVRITLDQSLCFLARHRSPEELFFNGVWGCGAGRRFLTIDPEGVVYPCSHFRKPVGFQGDFMQAWNDSILLEEFRHLEEKIKGRCESCRLVSVCRGCRAVVVELGGDFYDEDPHCPSRNF